MGVGGSGRKSLTTMAVHIAEFQMFTIEITKSYGMADWREDIKAMMNKAGVLNKPTVTPPLLLPPFAIANIYPLRDHT